MTGPRIACIGVIGKADNPLHISLFPPYSNAMMEFSFLLNSCLDIIEVRRKQTSIDQELGLLQAVDERLAAYGWITTTGVKLLIIVDTLGQESATTVRPARPAVSGLRDSDLKSAFRALQTAYIQLLQNPFYCPDTRAPAPGTSAGLASACQPISDSGFIAKVRRIGDTWVPGVPN